MCSTAPPTATAGGTASIDVPLGLWRFIDIRLSEPFFPENGWGEHASEKGLSGNSGADYDHDGESDLKEYALGGDATNPEVASKVPYMEYGIGNVVSYYNWQVGHTNPGIEYLAEWTDNLVSGTWSSTWDSTSSSATTNPAYTEAERQVHGGTNDHLFFRLNISQP